MTAVLLLQLKASDLAAGAVTLDAGMDSALSGAGALVTGSKDLTGATEQLATGAAALADGADKIGKTLTDGMTEAKEKYDNAYEKLLSVGSCCYWWKTWI